ncbi:ankyrin repeat domain-containing protein [Scytonema sp. UIC 10036]|uniref:ankyrin repeat domain-containing protein n=1 Tax=Scytonema sp. UIC 10036 TaxID=2304196 RepID=UPI00140FA82E|nr:ankyrin repeat domain-containing protein [Scytonema sp. UIC 10036]
MQLIDAVKSGNFAAVKELIQAGANVNQQDEYGWTPLNWAAGKGDGAIIKLLIEQKADVFNVGRDGRTPYLIALAAGHAEAIQLLKDAQAKAGEQKSSNQQEREYCKAFYLGNLRKFSGWTESQTNWKKDEVNNSNGSNSHESVFSDDDVVFLYQDLTVRASIWLDENVIFEQVTPEWKKFCMEVLKFKVPNDLELIAKD